MTKQLHIYCAIVMSAGMVAFAATSFGQDEDKKRSNRPAGGGGPLLRALDTNGDGELDQSEIDQAVASLRKLDKNKDGTVSQEEIGRPQPPKAGDEPRPAEGQPRRGFDLSSLDKDGDGKVSKEEAPERMKERFDRMDQNGDGFIDKKEQEQVMQFLRRRMQEGGDGQGKQRRPARDEGQGGSEKPKRPESDES